MTIKMLSVDLGTDRKGNILKEASKHSLPIIVLCPIALYFDWLKTAKKLELFDVQVINFYQIDRPPLIYKLPEKFVLICEDIKDCNSYQKAHIFDITKQAEISYLFSDNLPRVTIRDE